MVNDYVSDYANGPGGSLFTVSTLVHGVGNLAIAAGLGYALGRRNRAARAGVLLFALAAIGLLVAATFPTDSADAPQTVTGLVHRVAATGSFAVELAALALLALAFRADAAWRDYLNLSLALTMVAAIMLAWLLVAIGAARPSRARRTSELHGVGAHDNRPAGARAAPPSADALVDPGHFVARRRVPHPTLRPGPAARTCTVAEFVDSVEGRTRVSMPSPSPRRRPSPPKCARCDAQSRFPASQSPDLPLPMDLIGS